MLYINNQYVDLRNNDPNYAFKDVIKDYHDTIQGLTDRFGDLVLFKTIYKPRRDKVSKLLRPHKVFTIPYKTNIPNPKTGDDRWVYSPESVTIKDGIVEPSVGYMVLNYGSLPLSISDNAELIFYLTKTSKFRRGIIYLYDENEKQDKLASERAQSAKLTVTIFGEDTPLNDKGVLHTIARKWGIPNLESKKDATIKNLLYDKVVAAEELKRRNMTSEGLEAFLSQVKGESSIKEGSDIQLAIDSGKLSFSRDSNEWVLNTDGNPWVVLRVDGTEVSRAREVLDQWLIANPGEAQQIALATSGEAVVTKGKIEPVTPVPDDDKITALNAGNIMECEDYVLLKKAFAFYKLGQPVGKTKNLFKGCSIKAF